MCVCVFVGRVGDTVARPLERQSDAFAGMCWSCARVTSKQKLAATAGCTVVKTAVLATLDAAPNAAGLAPTIARAL